MKVTAKGRVIIPAEIRKQFGFHPGAEVEFVVEGNAAKRMTTDEILAYTRKEG